ncbi:AAA family ATPase [Sphingobium sp. LB126]|uniref:ATP-dependent nuclease n=1 Tax=Sphingobium sp. LB126 TaxID=1983755 RepID=UPI0012FD0182|nr:AAA family ATPase [Sphingobium sp. LB126]
MNHYSRPNATGFCGSPALTRLSDARREVLFSTFRDLFDLDISVESEFPDNAFSNRYISVDGESLSVTSSGTRLFLGILAALMDERFSVVAIDEPELGLSPALQAKLAKIIVDRERGEDLFPHKPHFVLSTHSHNFLDKQVPSNNFVVSRNGNLISAKTCKTFSELHDIQFRMLGNDLGSLFLPDAIILVEGETDRIYLNKVISLMLPGRRIVIEGCGGDIAARLNYWSSLLGDMQTSPYRNRTFIVLDSVKQSGIERVCNRVGIPTSSMVEWSDNGIEYLYPSRIISGIFKTNIATTSDLHISGDRVEFNGITYTKMQLCNLVVNAIQTDTEFPDELINKLVTPLKDAIEDRDSG